MLESPVPSSCASGRAVAPQELTWAMAADGHWYGWPPPLHTAICFLQLFVMDLGEQLEEWLKNLQGGFVHGVLHQSIVG